MISAGDVADYFVLIFRENRVWHFMQSVFLLCNNVQLYFFFMKKKKKKKNIINLLSTNWPWECSRFELPACFNACIYFSFFIYSQLSLSQTSRDQKLWFEITVLWDKKSWIIKKIYSRLNKCCPLFSLFEISVWENNESQMTVFIHEIFCGLSVAYPSIIVHLVLFINEVSGLSTTSYSHP